MTHPDESVQKPAPLPAAAPQPRRNTGLLIAVAVIVVLVIALAATLVALLGKGSDDSPKAAPSPSATPATFIASGTLELHGGYGPTLDGSCAGVRGYNDIAQGATVTITDSSGTVVALGSLGPGSATVGVCTFRWRVEGVPRGGEFYGVEVSHRGKVQERESDLAIGRAHLTLGS